MAFVGQFHFGRHAVPVQQRRQNADEAPIEFEARAGAITRGPHNQAA